MESGIYPGILIPFLLTLNCVRKGYSFQLEWRGYQKTLMEEKRCIICPKRWILFPESPSVEIFSFPFRERGINGTNYKENSWKIQMPILFSLVACHCFLREEASLHAVSLTVGKLWDFQEKRGETVKRKCGVVSCRGLEIGDSRTLASLLFFGS